MANKAANDSIAAWLKLTWDKPERSYNPNVRDFLSDLLGYPRADVVTEDSSGAGFPDIKLITPEKSCWVVGDLKKDDGKVTSSFDRMQLWEEKRKYITGLTRHVVFLTPHFIWLAMPNGDAAEGFEEPVDLRLVTRTDLARLLAPISRDAAWHERQWKTFTEGKLPYSYLKLSEHIVQEHLKHDLQDSFEELNQAGAAAMALLSSNHARYLQLQAQVDNNLANDPEARRRALNQLNSAFEPSRRIFTEALPSFEEQYGRELDVKNDSERLVRIKEAFIADSVAALVARVLFLRLVEDLKLTKKRRLSNGGPSNWSAFVEELVSDAQALIRTASEDVSRIYREPFQRSVFDWIQHTNGAVDRGVQRLILRLNAYDFSTLSEEILGDIYQQFLPPAKRKRLGEFYTPSSIVDWLLEETVRTHGGGTLLDPACGSGSFLVREVHARIEDAKHRGLDPTDVLDTLLREVWGFDLNPFAAFIAQFQVMWALLRFGRPSSDIPIQVHNLNSLLRDSDIARVLSQEHLPRGSVARDTQRWRYVVGNPPYIRAERVKYGSEMQHLWATVWGQNSDTGHLFLYRAIAEWLEPNGFLGMVVSGGYANSEACAVVWRLLNPGGSAALRKLVWLEFAGKIWDPNVIPLLLLIENRPPKEEDEIELYVPPEWPSGCQPSKIRYKDFFDIRVNPSPPTSVPVPWGAYLLPMIQAEDVSILRKLYPHQPGLRTLSDVVRQRGQKSKSAWTYGIQRGGVEATPTPHGAEPVAVIGGRDIAAACTAVPEQWVDLAAVRKRPYGKLSLWADGAPAAFIVLNELGLAPTAAVVRDSATAALNSVVIAEPDPHGPQPEAIAAYLNSSLARFYWAIRLRSGVLEGSSRSHFYPRTIELLPWPPLLTPQGLEALTTLYGNLASEARTARDNPDDWLLSHVAELPVQQCIKLTADRVQLSFGGWMDPKAGDLQQQGCQVWSGLSSFTVADEDLAELVAMILVRDAEEQITRNTIQKLMVPLDWKDTMQKYRKRLQVFSSIQNCFHATVREIDAVIYRGFGLTGAEQTHVEARLASFPFNRLQPRYPWTIVKQRPLKAYTEDRFTK